MIIKSVKKLGYSLIEAVIAVTVLSIILVTGISVIVTATQTEATNKNYLIANMLAQEGIEAVKNIYYSNILRFGSENANSCAFVHLTLDSPVDEIDTCGSKFIWAGSYILKRDTDSGYLKWLLGSEAEDDDYTGAVMANTEDDTLNPIYRLYLQNNISGIPTYTHESIGTEPSKYYREIYIDSETDPTVAQITSRIGWLRDGGQVRVLELTATLPLTF